VRVIRNCGTTNATRSNEESVSLQAASPELFVFALNAEGGNPVIAQNAVTGELIAEPGMLPSVTFVPAKPGDIISVFGTGFGLTDPAVPAGELAGGAAPLAGKVKVLLAGWELNSEDVLYAGTAPGFAGLYQINFRIPAVGLQGDLLITVRVGSLTSPLGPSLHVVR
jgi:uncharacterized protein (TIGR03437 family)